jgi:4,5-DOPA dioxygenase extradiol
MEKTPLLFVGHGNPMNAITDNIYTREWEKLGKSLNKPKAIICISAHWLTSGSFITANFHPETIYDFYGFPDELYRVKYPASGYPDLADEIHKNYPDIRVDLSRGLDHGAWTVLSKIFPDADIPVVQISIDVSAPPQKQFDLLYQLRDLRYRNIMFIGSGNIVHNLGLAGVNRPPYDWAADFEQTAEKLIKSGNIKALIDYRNLGLAAELSIPSDDHYRPMLNTMALKFDGETPVFFNAGIDLGSVSMLSFIYN